MNIYANRGDKVIFANPANGYTSDQVKGREFLKIGETYTIERTAVSSYSTAVYLLEIPGVPFNSVLFEDDELATKNPSPRGEYIVTKMGANISYEGVLLSVPKVGEKIIITYHLYNNKRVMDGSILITTKVKKIEDDLYHTQNSIYKISKVK